MRLKEFLAELAKIDGWYLADTTPRPSIRLGEVNQPYECPLTAIYNRQPGEGTLPLKVGDFLIAADALCITRAVAAAADDEPERVLNAEENINELRSHLLRATKLAPA